MITCKGCTYHQVEFPEAFGERRHIITTEHFCSNHRAPYNPPTMDVWNHSCRGTAPQWCPLVKLENKKGA